MQTHVDGLFHGAYDVSFEAPEQIVPAKRASIFPGQGSSYPGMFVRELAGFQEFKNIFALADRTANNFDLLPISKYLTSPAEIPTEKVHIYRSCALFSVEVAASSTLVSRGLAPDLVTGHSFGECAALVSAGIIDFESMLNVVIHRNLICPRPGELGIMIALTADEEKCRDLLSVPGVYLANVNSQKQWVLSIAKSAEVRAFEELRRLRIPHVALTQLPQPYHSPLMEVYRKQMNIKIRELELRPQAPDIPCYSGVTHQWIDKSNFKSVDYADLLSAQITTPVDFIKQVSALRERGAGVFYEVGPGKMLNSSVSANLKGEQITCRDAESLLGRLMSRKSENVQPDEGSKDLSKSNWFGKVRNMIASVTGYQPDTIDINHSFQNDLGIDSIKKAEILFKLISQENIGSGSDFSITSFSTIYQIVDYLENYSEEFDPLRVHFEQKIELLESCLTEASLPVYDFFPDPASLFSLHHVTALDSLFSEARRCVKETDPPRQAAVIVELHRMTQDEQIEFLYKTHQDYLEFKKLEPLSRFQICLVDRSANAEMRALGALLKSIAREDGSFTARFIHSPDNMMTPHQLVRELSWDYSADVKYTEGKRYQRELKKAPTTERNNERLSVVIAIGGSSGINFEILLGLKHDLTSQLVLIGRRKADDPLIAENLTRLRAAWPRLDYVCADARDQVSLAGAIDQAIKKYGQIDVLINSTGLEVSELFEDRSIDSLKEEIKSKILPVQNIENLKGKLVGTRVFHFTSIVSYFGNKGQAAYSFVNSLIESIAESGSSVAISWGPWARVGKTENEGILQRIKEAGMSLITPEEGVQLADRILHSSNRASVIFAMDHKDIFLFNLSHVGHEHVSPILGESQNKFAAVVYKDIYLDKETFLNDHVILGKKVLPACYLLAQFLEVSRLQFGRLTSIESFHLQNLIIFDDNHASIKSQFFFREPFQLSVYSLVQNCTARLDPDHHLAPQMAPTFLPSTKIDTTRLYADGVFEFGPKFRLIKECYRDGKGNVQLIVDTRTLPEMLGGKIFDFYASLFELGFQALTVHSSLESGLSTVPVGCDKISFVKDLKVSAKISVLPLVQAQDDKFMYGDILFANDNGDVFAKITGFKMKLHRLVRKAITTESPISI